jgi:hypothetical protein
MILKRKFYIIPVVIIFGVILFAGLKSFADRKAESLLEEAFQKAALYADITYRDVFVDLFGLNTHINGVVITPADSGKRTVIDKIVVYNVDQKNDFPQCLKISLRGIHPDRSGSVWEYFQNLGYEEQDIKLDIDLEYIYQAEEKSFYIQELNYGAPNIAMLSFSLHISNIDLDSDSLFLTPDYFLNVLFHEAELRIYDYSLVNKFLKMKAGKEKKDPHTYLQEILVSIDWASEDGENAFAASIYQSLKDFLQNPDIFIIRAEPDAPVRVERLLDIQELDEAAGLLNISLGS